VAANFGEWMSGLYRPVVLATNLSSRIHFSLAVPVFRITPESRVSGNWIAALMLVACSETATIFRRDRSEQRAFTVWI
jgi:hypothetical protein